MGREIKFRAWDKRAKKWVKSFQLYFPKCELAGNFVSDEDIELIQYTGLKDRVGKEIYEGDVLAPMKNDYSPEYKGDWIMTFDRGTFLAVSVDDRFETWAPYWTEQQFEIIGNIYENPELLKE